MQRLKRNLLIAVCATFALVALCYRIYFEYVPRGVEYIPFTGHSFELPKITSPNGKSYRVYVNDAGGMHSGNYWTWVIDRDLLTGRFVVTEGYITSEYSTGDSDLNIEWDGDTPVIQFENGRY